MKGKDTTVAPISVSPLKVDEYVPSNKDGVLATLSGRFSSSKERSRNDRVYSDELLRSIPEDPLVKEMLSTKTFFGELSHPATDVEYLWEVQISNASHNITDLRYDDRTGELVGKLDILDTPSGRIADTLLKYGSQLGISSRGVGSNSYSIGSSSDHITPENYNFITFDLVALPGIPGARLNPVFESMRGSSSTTAKDFISVVESARGNNDIESLRVIESIVDGNEELMKVVTEAIDKSFSDNIQLAEDNKVTNKPSEEGDSDSTDVQSNDVPSTDEVDDITKELEDEITELQNELDDELEEDEIIDESVESGGVTQVSNTGNVVSATGLITPEHPDGIKEPKLESVSTDSTDEDDEVEIDETDSVLQPADDELLVNWSLESDEDIDEFIKELHEDTEEEVTMRSDIIDHLGNLDVDILESIRQVRSSQESSEVIRLKRELNDAIVDKGILESRLSRIMSDVSDLNESYKKATNSVNRSRSKIYKLNEANSKLLHQNKLLKMENSQERSLQEKRLESVRSESSLRRKDVTRLTAENESLKRKIAKLERELKTKDGAILESRRSSKISTLAKAISTNPKGVNVAVNESISTTNTEDSYYEYDEVSGRGVHLGDDEVLVSNLRRMNKSHK